MGGASFRKETGLPFLSCAGPAPGPPPNDEEESVGPSGKITYEDLNAKGVEFPQEPTQQFWGGFEATFKDPAGNLFKLLQMKA